MAKIGILGGSFNPLHNGHLHLARGFYESLGLDFVLLIPVCLPPHKDASGIAPPDDRLAMCREACRGRPWLLVSNVELRRGGRSYTADTLETLSREFPGDTFYLLMGADMFLTLEEWRRFEVIARLCVLCCARRDEEPKDRLTAYAACLSARYGARCRVQDIPILPLSSTLVRGMVARGEDVSGLVPPAIAALIAQKGLYKAH